MLAINMARAVQEGSGTRRREERGQSKGKKKTRKRESGRDVEVVDEMRALGE